MTHSSPRGRRRSPSHSGAASKRDAYWIGGHHAVTAALRNPRRLLLRLLSTAEDTVPPRETATATPTVEKADRATLDALFPIGFPHQGIAALARPLPAVMLEDLLASIAADSRFVALDQVTDPHNVGAILRSAAAFGVTAVIMTDRHAPPETAVLAKAASGALEQTPLVRVPNLARALEQLAAAGCWRIGLAGDAAQPLSAALSPGPVVLALGAEGVGLRRLTREKCDILARIQMESDTTVGSLNVSAAAAIGLYAVGTSRATAAASRSSGRDSAPS